MFARLTGSAPWVTLSGVIGLLIGLGWDAALHRLDPELAAREGVFAPSNPGHLLFGGGIALTVAGMALFLAGRAVAWQGRSRGRWAALGGSAVALLALAGVSFGVAATSGGGLTGGPRHVHEDGTVHTHEQHETFVAQQQGEPAGAHAHDGAQAAVSAAVAKGVTHDHGDAVAVTSAELEAAAKLAADVRTGAARLSDFATAQREGYRQITAGRNGLAHYLNQTYLTDGRVLDPERPESLMYFRMPDGEMKLVGVMFLMPPGEPGPRVGGALTAWHAHDNLCYSTRTGIITALTNAAGQCPAGTVYRGKTPEMMHVWLVDNPNGVFGDEMEPAALLRLLTGAAN
jgi:hypothetical protein